MTKIHILILVTYVEPISHIPSLNPVTHTDAYSSPFSYTVHTVVFCVVVLYIVLAVFRRSPCLLALVLSIIVILAVIVPWSYWTST